MKIGAQTVHALRSIAMRQDKPGETATCHPLSLTIEEARELYESYTSARMYEQAQEHHARQKAASETREKAMETRIASLETQLVTSAKLHADLAGRMAAANAAELRGAERMLTRARNNGVECTCFIPGATGGSVPHAPYCATAR